VSTCLPRDDKPVESETHYNMQNCYPLTAVGVYFQVFNARHP